jgi:hypothetical protein
VFDGSAPRPSAASRRQVSSRSRAEVFARSSRVEAPSQYDSSARFSSRRGPILGYPSTVEVGNAAVTLAPCFAVDESQGILPRWGPLERIHWQRL